MDVVNVRDAWKNLMGNGVNNYTTEIQLKGSTLYVALSSAVLREELSYGKDKIIKMINEELRKDYDQCFYFTSLFMGWDSCYVFWKCL